MSGFMNQLDYVALWTSGQACLDIAHALALLAVIGATELAHTQLPRVGWPDHHLGLPGLLSGVRPVTPAGWRMMGGWMTVLTSLDGRYRC